MRAVSSIFVLLILAAGCAHGPVLKKDPAGFDTRLLELKYDRHKVSFLFLVSPKSAEASLDDRVLEHLHLMIEKVQDCQTHSPLTYWTLDYFGLDEIDKHLVKLSRASGTALRSSSTSSRNLALTAWRSPLSIVPSLM